jgi:hypothetical protein
MKPIHLCKNLRTKSMLVPALADQPLAPPGEEANQAGHCWCNRTLTEVGPDEQPVGPQVCTAARPCFEE